MPLNISISKEVVLKPRIKILGVGGAGGNAVNNMSAANLEGAEFLVANTDAQALSNSLIPHKIQLGTICTQGLGAGSHPEVGKAAAEEALPELKAAIEGCNMLFITAGMGGGTGTGAAPVIAKAAKEMGILVVGVVTKPFHFEGVRRMKIAELGLEEISCYVDTLIIIPNQNLFRIANEKTTFVDAFRMADSVLHSGVRSVTDLITMPGLINLDFADIRTVMQEMGKAMMGTGEAEGEDRAIKAAEAAISNPLLDNSSMKGAKGVLINITGGVDMTLFEVDEAANRIREEVDAGANIIFGSAFNEELKGKLRVSVVATGISSERNVKQSSPFKQDVANVSIPKEAAAESLIHFAHSSATIPAPADSNIKTSDTPREPFQKEPFIMSKILDPEDNDDGEDEELIPPSSKASHTDAPSKGLFDKVVSTFQQKPLVLEDMQGSVGNKVKNDTLFDIPSFLRKRS